MFVAIVAPQQLSSDVVWPQSLACSKVTQIPLLIGYES